MSGYSEKEYLRDERLPHFFCAGCGCGQILNYFTQSLRRLNLRSEDIVAIAGVGCAARIPVYLKCDTLHGIHGRTLAWSTGIKTYRPDIPVVVFAGDGDLASIGGNHFIHAARRNLDVTVILVNNLNFAMTGGQVAPTTPEGSKTMTTPYGSGEPQFDVARLAMAAGASHVERWSTAAPSQCVDAICRALEHKGFSLVEILSQCPTQYGRYALGTGDPVKVFDFIKNMTVSCVATAGITADGERLAVGEFIRESRPIYTGTSKSFERE